VITTTTNNTGAKPEQLRARRLWGMSPCSGLRRALSRPRASSRVRGMRLSMFEPKSRLSCRLDKCLSVGGNFRL
jgi:hypothetical protein